MVYADVLAAVAKDWEPGHPDFDFNPLRRAVHFVVAVRRSLFFSFFSFFDKVFMDVAIVVGGSDNVELSLLLLSSYYDTICVGIALALPIILSSSHLSVVSSRRRVVKRPPSVARSCRTSDTPTFLDCKRGGWTWPRACWRRTRTHWWAMERVALSRALLLPSRSSTSWTRSDNSCSLTGFSFFL